MPRRLGKGEGTGRGERGEVPTLSQGRSLAPQSFLNNRALCKPHITQGRRNPGGPVFCNPHCFFLISSLTPGFGGSKWAALDIQLYELSTRPVLDFTSWQEAARVQLEALCVWILWQKRIYKQNLRAFLRKKNWPLFSQEPQNYLHAKQIALKLTVNDSGDVSFTDPGNSPETPLEFENCC